MIKKILVNGYIPIIPILIWNLLFINDLPVAFMPESFNTGIPIAVLWGENFFRTIIFILPLSFMIQLKTKKQKTGLFVFCIGSFLYIASWLALMFIPDSNWAKSIYGFSAPAYTPLLWLTGLSLMVEKYYFRFKYSVWHYIIPALLFTGLHIIHTVLVYYRTYEF